MAVSHHLSTLFFPSKWSWPPPTCLHSLPSQLRLPQTSSSSSSGWSSLVAAPKPLSATASDISSPIAIDVIAYPALAYSTTLYFKSAYNVQVIVDDDNEPEENLINRFRREVLKAGVLQECKRRRFFENKHEKNKRKTREAARKYRKRRPQSKAPAQNKHEAPKKKQHDEENDNWELPDVDLPYC